MSQERFRRIRVALERFQRVIEVSRALKGFRAISEPVQESS